MSDIELFDTICHLDFEDFDHDRQDVIARSHQNGVRNILVPSVDAETFDRTIECCLTSPSLHLALGLHPMFIKKHQPQDLTTLDSLLNREDAACQPIAVGEIGLDFYDKSLDREKQLLYFSKQLIIAKRAQLPVVIHNRKAHDQCLQLLTENRVPGGFVHAFNGSLEQARRYIELGFALGFGGMLTFERSRKLRELVDKLPIESVVLESDAPDMTVVQHKGQRNSPEYLPYVLAAIADIKRITPQEVAQVTSNNAKTILNM